MITRGTADEFHIWRFWRFYWCKVNDRPAHTEYFANLFGRLFFLKRDPQAYGRSRFTDDDVVFGPLTVAKTDWNNLSLILKSANRDEEESHCTLTGYGFGYGFRLFLPAFIKPVMEKTKAISWDEETIKRMGRDWYPTYHSREYGFSCHEGHLSIYYGMQNSNGWGGDMINRRFGYFLPWTQWRFVRHSVYDANRELFYEYNHSKDKENKDLSSEKKSECSAVYFLIRDYDGKKIVAKTVIEEREWLKGEKWCAWLSFFFKPLVRRVVDIQFAEEVGTGKGSWKGGLCGTSIDIEANETHEQGFIRYCMKDFNAKEGRYRIEYIRRVDPSELILLVPAKCSW